MQIKEQDISAPVDEGNWGEGVCHWLLVSILIPMRDSLLPGAHVVNSVVNVMHTAHGSRMSTGSSCNARIFIFLTA